MGRVYYLGKPDSLFMVAERWRWLDPKVSNAHDLSATFGDTILLQAKTRIKVMVDDHIGAAVSIDMAHRKLAPALAR